MPIAVQCPNRSCGKTLVIKEPAGQPLICPHCDQSIPSLGPVATQTVDRPESPVAAPATASFAAPGRSPIQTCDWPGAAEANSEKPAQELPGHIGRFTVRRRLGEGAFGVVYQAYDPQLEREVAIKVAKPEMLRTETRVKRFLREARAAANLRHPHVVPVFDSGKEGADYYIAYAFINGGSLHDALTEVSPRGLAPKRAVRIVQRLAEALGYAHGKGIVHRDVKPANVMLDEQDEPLLMDFGLAAWADGEEKLTDGGQGMGTPAYMAPEQAEGNAGPASDQYSLGATLYELLTGRTPFVGPPHLQIIQHRSAEPPPPSRHHKGLPRDLETICLKCLEKDPAGRYANCQALAEDLRRWQAGEPIAARRLGTAERLVRWVRKEPKLAGALAAVAALLVGVAVVLGVAVQQEAEAARRQAELRHDADSAAVKARQEAHRADEEAAKAREERDRAEEQVYFGKIALADREWEGPQWQRSNTLLSDCRPDRRGWEHDFLNSKINHSGKCTLRGHTDGVACVAFSPDGTFLASGSLDPTVKVWDMRSGMEVRTLKGHTQNIYSVAFSPDGARLASASGDKTVKIWDARSGQEVRTLAGYYSNSLAFSPDSTRLACGNADRTVKVWDVRNGQEILTFKGHTDRLISVAFSPDGARLASAGVDKTVKVWDVGSGQEIFTLNGHTACVDSVAFSPDGTRLASGGEDRMVKVWDARSGQELHTFSGYFSTSVAFSPDGTRLASGNADKTVKVWDVRSKKEVLALKGHTGDVTSVAFSPDGARLASASSDKTVILWDARSGQEALTIKGHSNRATSVALSPDGVHLASSSADMTAKVWDARTGHAVHILQHAVPKEHMAAMQWNRNEHCVAFSPDGERLASTSGQLLGGVHVWDVRSGKKVFTFTGHTDMVTSVSFSPDGARLASACETHLRTRPGEIKVWDLRSGQEVLSLKGQVIGVSFSPDGARLASNNADGTVQVWDALSGQDVLSLKGHTGRVTSVSFSPDGARLASAGSDRTVKLWDARSGQEVLSLKGHAAEVTSVSFSPDGSRLASGSWDRTVKVWDARSGQEILTLQGNSGAVTSVSFSPDGSRLASGSDDGTVKVWDARTDAQIIRLRGHAANGVNVSFSTDGNRIVSRDAKGITLVWNRYGLLLSESPPTDLKEGPLSPDGNWKAEIYNQAIDLVATQRRDFWKEMNDRVQSPTWHAADAAAAEKAADWFAAVFHLRRMQQLKSNDRTVPARLDQALQKLKAANVPPPRLPLPVADPKP